MPFLQNSVYVVVVERISTRCTSYYYSEYVRLDTWWKPNFCLIECRKYLPELILMITAGSFSNNSYSKVCLTICCGLAYSTESAAGNSKQVDLFGDSLIGDLMDAPTPAPAQTSATNGNASEVDLFADATFVSAQPEQGMGVNSQTKVRLFFLYVSRNAICYVFACLCLCVVEKAFDDLGITCRSLK